MFTSFVPYSESEFIAKLPTKFREVETLVQYLQDLSRAVLDEFEAANVSQTLTQSYLSSHLDILLSNESVEVLRLAAVVCCLLSVKGRIYAFHYLLSYFPVKSGINSRDERKNTEEEAQTIMIVLKLLNFPVYTSLQAELLFLLQLRDNANQTKYLSLAHAETHFPVEFVKLYEFLFREECLQFRNFSLLLQSLVAIIGSSDSTFFDEADLHLLKGLYSDLIMITNKYDDDNFPYTLLSMTASGYVGSSLNFSFSEVWSKLSIPSKLREIQRDQLHSSSSSSSLFSWFFSTESVIKDEIYSEQFVNKLKSLVFAFFFYSALRSIFMKDLLSQEVLNEHIFARSHQECKSFHVSQSKRTRNSREKVNISSLRNDDFLYFQHIIDSYVIPRLGVSAEPQVKNVYYSLVDVVGLPSLISLNISEFAITPSEKERRLEYINGLFKPKMISRNNITKEINVSIAPKKPLLYVPVFTHHVFLDLFLKFDEMTYLLILQRLFPELQYYRNIVDSSPELKTSTMDLAALQYLFVFSDDVNSKIADQSDTISPHQQHQFRVILKLLLFRDVIRHDNTRFPNLTQLEFNNLCKIVSNHVVTASDYYDFFFCLIVDDLGRTCQLREAVGIIDNLDVSHDQILAICFQNKTIRSALFPSLQYVSKDLHCLFYDIRLPDIIIEDSLPSDIQLNQVNASALGFNIGNAIQLEFLPFNFYTFLIALPEKKSRAFRLLTEGFGLMFPFSSADNKSFLCQMNGTLFSSMMWLTERFIQALDDTDMVEFAATKIYRDFQEFRLQAIEVFIDSFDNTQEYYAVARIVALARILTKSEFDSFLRNVWNIFPLTKKKKLIEELNISGLGSDKISWSKKGIFIYFAPAVLQKIKEQCDNIFDKGLFYGLQELYEIYSNARNQIEKEFIKPLIIEKNPGVKFVNGRISTNQYDIPLLVQFGTYDSYEKAIKSKLSAGSITEVRTVSCLMFILFLFFSSFQHHDVSQKNTGYAAEDVVNRTTRSLLYEVINLVILSSTLLICVVSDFEEIKCRKTYSCVSFS
jgi:hypothetical protein